ncbi:FecR domain-containing protein [Trinickia soli]|uniref:FecR domain-containing protein n=1 Tax=Trinickia soli TaxID=380675 RepID=UPI003FA3CAED
MHSRLADNATASRGQTFGAETNSPHTRWRDSLAAAGAAIALLLTAPACAQTFDAGLTAKYVTAAGDTLYEVAQRYLTDAKGWRALAGLNHISAPRRLPAGMTLRLPLALLRRDAEPASVIATSGLVTIRSRGHFFGAAATPAMPLLVGRTVGESDAVSTGPDGFATLELADGSYVSLTPNSSIVLSILRKMALTGINERVIELDKGEVSNEVTHAKQPGDRFEVHTPSIVAGVRGTHFRVQVSPSMSAVEVLDGRVAVGTTTDVARRGSDEAQPRSNTARLVEAGNGSATLVNGEVGAPQPLLPAPRLVDPSKVQANRSVTFNLEPQAGADGYRVQIARDADLLDLIRDAHVQAPSATFSDIADGTYFVRVSAIDRNGLEGLPRVYAFERRANEISASAAPGSRLHEYRFIWRASRTDGRTDADTEARFRFVLALHRDLHDPILDVADLTSTSLAVSNLPPGDYYWRVIAEQHEHGRFYETPGPVREFTLAN